MPYVVSVLGVRKRPFELARGSVIPMVRAEVTPADRSPLRIATSDAPGTALRNTSTPRIRSSAAYTLVTVSGRGTPSKKSSCPKGDSMVSLVDNPAMASFISSGDIPAPMFVSDISTPTSQPHLDESLFHRTSSGAIIGPRYTTSRFVCPAERRKRQRTADESSGSQDPLVSRSTSRR